MAMAIAMETLMEMAVIISKSLERIKKTVSLSYLINNLIHLFLKNAESKISQKASNNFCRTLASTANNLKI
jgi:hypothetical protein